MLLLLLTLQAVAAPLAVDLRCRGLGWEQHELSAYDADGLRIAHERVPRQRQSVFYLHSSAQAVRLVLEGPVCAWQVELEVQALRAGAIGARGVQWAWMADGTGGTGPLPGRCELALETHRAALEAYVEVPRDLWVCLQQPGLTATVSAWWPELAARLGPGAHLPRELYEAYLVAGLPGPQARTRIHNLRGHRDGPPPNGVVPHIDLVGQRYLLAGCRGTAERAEVRRSGDVLFLTPAEGEYQVVPVEPELLDGVVLVLCQRDGMRETWVDHGLRNQQEAELKVQPRAPPAMPTSAVEVAADPADPLVKETLARVRAGEQVAAELIEDAVRQGLVHRDTWFLAMDLAHRLPCERTLSVFAEQHERHLPRAVKTCAERDVTWWLEAARIQLDGGFAAGVLPPPPQVTDEVRSYASRLLLAARGTGRWRDQLVASWGILSPDPVTGGLLLEPGATPYALVRSVSRQWGCDGSAPAETVDDMMIMPWTGAVPENQVLWLTEEEAQVRWILCGTRITEALPEG